MIVIGLLAIFSVVFIYAMATSLYKLFKDKS